MWGFIQRPKGLLYVGLASKSSLLETSKMQMYAGFDMSDFTFMAYRKKGGGGGKGQEGGASRYWV